MRPVEYRRQQFRQGHLSGPRKHHTWPIISFGGIFGAEYFREDHIFSAHVPVGPLPKPLPPYSSFTGSQRDLHNVILYKSDIELSELKKIDRNAVKVLDQLRQVNEWTC